MAASGQARSWGGLHGRALGRCPPPPPPPALHCWSIRYCGIPPLEARELYPPCLSIAPPPPPPNPTQHPGTRRGPAGGLLCTQHVPGALRVHGERLHRQPPLPRQRRAGGCSAPGVGGLGRERKSRQRQPITHCAGCDPSAKAPAYAQHKSRVRHPRSSPLLPPGLFVCPQVHAYLQLPAGRTGYLSELRSGQVGGCLAAWLTTTSCQSSARALQDPLE